MDSKQFDVIILGAGPAGSTCALALKQSGLNIALIDKEDFPRDKICGDSVSSAAKRILRSFDPQLEQQLLAFEKKSNISKAKIYSPQFESLQIHLRTVSHCIRRVDFDNWLYQAAIENNPSVNILTGSPVKAIERKGTSIAVSLANSQHLTTKLLIACDGAQSIAAKVLGGFTIDRQHYSGAVRQYFQNVKELQEDTSEVYFLNDYLPGYFWIFPLHNNQANVGFGMLSSTISQKKIDLRKSLSSIIRDIPEIARRFSDAQPIDEIKGFGLPLGSKKRSISGDGFMLCGDAASLIDPFSGEGIVQAMESGVFAAEQAKRCFETDKFHAEFVAEYDRRVHAKFWKSFRLHYFLQRALSDRKWLINGIISLGNIPYINRNIPKWFY